MEYKKAPPPKPTPPPVAEYKPVSITVAERVVEYKPNKPSSVTLYPDDDMIQEYMVGEITEHSEHQDDVEVVTVYI